MIVVEGDLALELDARGSDGLSPERCLLDVGERDLRGATAPAAGREGDGCAEDDCG
jgi:hypothetical protein